MNKYRAKMTVVDGHVFDSKKEARRYGELRLLERAGEIHGLELQKEFELIPVQRRDGRVCERAVKYRADFCYIDKSGQYVAEDVKGYTGGASYRLFAVKRKLMLQRYGIEVREI